MARYDLYEALKRRKQKMEGKDTGAVEETLALDDVSRVKVLSPARQVVKRFMRNRIAVVGLVILAIMFFFSFAGPLFYPYGQKQIFYKFDDQNQDYGLAKRTVNYNGYKVDADVETESNVVNMMNSNIKSMAEAGEKVRIVEGASGIYEIEMIADDVYTLSAFDFDEICIAGNFVRVIGTYDSVGKRFTFEDEEIPGLENAAASNITGKEGEFKFGGVTYSFIRGKAKRYDVTAISEGSIAYTGSIAIFSDEEKAEFEAALMSAIETGEDFKFGGKEYMLLKDDEAYHVGTRGDKKVAMVYTLMTVDTAETSGKVSDSFRVAALMAMGERNAEKGVKFKDGDKTYTLSKEGEIWSIVDDTGELFAEMTYLSIRRTSGQDSMEFRLKKAIAEAISSMNEEGVKEKKITFELPMQAEDSSYMYDDEGNLQYKDAEIDIIQRNTGEYVIKADQTKYLIDIYASPSKTHIFGTDGDGFDVLARIMFGGRVSLMVGFVVVFLEIAIGVILGGLAGYYGGWVDMLIMRVVDVFYCLPTLPIMIIIGASMDAMRMEPYRRLIVMMIALGVMGWAGVARMVRGQILSLREQEFMIATEATGVKVSTRIFKHLIPNVMPQLIVIATLGIGSTILYESTLSFLGLGVKHPLATWGTMINSVSTAAAMQHYPFIWIPVGLLISLTVVAFNFVGDGLRDAYDPKSKR